MDKIKQIKEYLESENSNLSLFITENKIVIKSSILRIRFFFHLFLVACIIVGATKMESFSFTLPSLVLVAVSILIWIDFESINDLIFDLQQKEFRIKSKNPIKRLFLKLFNKRTLYTFNDIEKIKFSFVDNINIFDKRHFIILVLKKKGNIKLLDVPKEKHAAYIANFLTQLIRS